MAETSIGHRFFIGIGGQRCGTTWLSQYLRDHPEVGFSPLKEVRFFDSKYVPELAGIVRNPLQTRLAMRGLAGEVLRRPFRVPELGWYLRGVRNHDDEHYRRYMRAVARGRKIGGEISPSYALLDEHAIGEMDRILEKPLYLLSLRNPADRLLSEISFRRNKLGKETDIARDDMASLVARRLEQSPHGDYAGAVRRYHKVSGPERLKVFFYEDLFHPERQQAVLDSVTAFLGIAPKPGDLDRRVNPSSKFRKGSDEERLMVVKAFASQYRFAEERFGDSLPENWKQDLALLRAGSQVGAN